MINYTVPTVQLQQLLMFHLFLLSPSILLKQIGKSVLVTLNFVYLHVGRAEQFRRVCSELSGWGLE